MEAQGNILIVEDRPDDALLLENILTSLGHKVWVAQSGDDALKLVKNMPFAAVLTELLLPKMPGAELTKNILKVSPYSNIIVMTTYSFIGSAIEVMESGAYGYITKPFNATEIKVVVAHAVERYILLASDQEKVHFAKLSVVDGLTGVYNHRYFDLFITNKIKEKKRYDDTFALLMIDVDNFKKYNDTYGHPAGDELLRNMVKLIQKSLRQDDVLFRYGGEEFAVYVSLADKRSASLVAERIKTLVNLYMPTTVSIGISGFPEDGADMATVVSRSDQALYQAKTTGKNRVCLA